MYNYQGLLNPSQFPQQRMAPQGASYWMQYAQPPQPLNIGPQGGWGTPTAPPGNPGTPGTPGTPTPPVTPPTTPPRPPGPAGGGDTGWGPRGPDPRMNKQQADLFLQLLRRNGVSLF